MWTKKLEWSRHWRYALKVDEGPQAKVHRQPLEAEKDKETDFPLETPEETSLDYILISA